MAASRSSRPRCRPVILLADDFADAREMYAEYLIFAGFDVITACDGAEALREARRIVPDLILMDMTMPGVDGWEATRQIKADHALRQIPVIALTAHALAEHQVRMREVGCDGVLAKPCLPDMLVKEVRSWTGTTKT